MEWSDDYTPNQAGRPTTKINEHLLIQTLKKTCEFVILNGFAIARWEGSEESLCCERSFAYSNVHAHTCTQEDKIRFF